MFGYMFGKILGFLLFLLISVMLPVKILQSSFVVPSFLEICLFHHLISENHFLTYTNKKKATIKW